MELKLSIKQVLLDLLSIWEQVQDHFKENDKYETLIKFLSEKDYYNDDDLFIPNLTEISKQTGIKSHILRKQLKEMYDTLFDFEKGRVLDFKKTEIWFNLEYFKRYAGFRCSELQHLPRIGECLNIPFLRANLGFDRYYVKDIRHDFSGTTHFIDMDLKGGFYNKYYKFRLDEAVAKNELGFGVESKLYDYEIEERLGLHRF